MAVAVREAGSNGEVGDSRMAISMAAARCRRRSPCALDLEFRLTTREVDVVFDDEDTLHGWARRGLGIA
jgi:hypothetical protein